MILFPTIVTTFSRLYNTFHASFGVTTFTVLVVSDVVWKKLGTLVTILTNINANALFPAQHHMRLLSNHIGWRINKLLHIPYTRQSTHNLKFHQPIEAVALKASSGISVKKALLVNERKIIAAMTDEVNKYVWLQSRSLYIKRFVKYLTLRTKQ